MIEAIISWIDVKREREKEKGRERERENEIRDGTTMVRWSMKWFI